MNSEQIKGNGGIFCGIDITKLRLLGEGRQGRVYLLPDSRAEENILYKKRGLGMLVSQNAKELNYVFPIGIFNMEL